MASGVPKRREGGVAAVIYNLGQEMERFGHEVCYVFLEDLVPDGSVSARFRDLVFSWRASRCLNRMFLSVLRGRYWKEVERVKASFATFRESAA